MQLKYYFILQNHVIFHVIFVSQTMFISWQTPKASNTENACRIALVQLVAHRSSAGGRDGLVIWWSAKSFELIHTHMRTMVLEYAHQHLPHKSPSYVGK